MNHVIKKGNSGISLQEDNLRNDLGALNLTMNGFERICNGTN